MQFNDKKSNFNFYRKQSQNAQNIENQYEGNEDNERCQNLLSENSNNMGPQIINLGGFSRQIHSSSNKDDESHQYYCIKCNQTYDGLIKCRHDSQDLENKKPHQYQVQNNKIYTCSYQSCEKKFNLESGLIRHRIVHTGERPYSCDFQNCSQTFNQKSNLNRHKKIHKNQKPFICDKCCKSFTTTTNLKQHTQTHISKKEERKIYNCEIKGCDKKYLYRCNLKKHKQQHDDPVSLCLQKQNDNKTSIKKAKFQISLNQCNITLQIRDDTTEDHSQIKITYDEDQGPNSQRYNPILMLPNDDKEQNEKKDQLQNEKMQQQRTQQLLIRNLEQFFINKSSQISTSFYLHPQLIEYRKIIMSQVATLLQQKGTKEIRFFVEKKEEFKKCVQSLIQIYFEGN